jgi:hypothetical protein
LTGVAVNVTDVPGHIAPKGEAAILTLTGITALTTIVIAFDVTGLTEVHANEEVIITVTTSPFERVEEL